MNSFFVFHLNSLYLFEKVRSLGARELMHMCACVCVYVSLFFFLSFSIPFLMHTTMRLNESSWFNRTLLIGINTTPVISLKMVVIFYISIDTQNIAPRNVDFSFGSCLVHMCNDAMHFKLCQQTYTHTVISIVTRRRGRLSFAIRKIRSKFCRSLQNESVFFFEHHWFSHTIRTHSYTQWIILHPQPSSEVHTRKHTHTYNTSVFALVNWTNSKWLNRPNFND